MKVNNLKLCIASAILMVSSTVTAQDNIFPETGNVGIGFTSLSGYKLTVKSSLQGSALIDPETEDIINVPGITPFRIIAQDYDPEEFAMHSNFLSEAFLYDYNQSPENMRRVYSLNKDGKMLLGDVINLSYTFPFTYSLITDNSIYSKENIYVDNKIGIGTTSPQASIDMQVGKMLLNDNPIMLRNYVDNNHYLKYVGSFMEKAVDGPALVGYGGGVLGTSQTADKGILYWKSNGRIGINTASPLKEFHVNGSAIIRNEATEASRGVVTTNYNPSGNSGTLLELANGDLIMGGGLSDNKFIFHMQYWDADADALIMAPIIVGSHKWSRSLKLVNDGRLIKNVDLGTDIAFETYNNETGNKGAFFKVYGNGSVEATEIRSVVTESENAFVVENTTDNEIDFLVKGDGTVYAREVEVNLNTFPDYVFEETYKLMNLEELRTYIKEEKHLPGIKSADQVSEEGIGLGELSRIQMEKIEELTLYILQLEERIKQLEASQE
jgi:hypothetical protein